MTINGMIRKINRLGYNINASQTYLYGANKNQWYIMLHAANKSQAVVWSEVEHYKSLGAALRRALSAAKVLEKSRRIL